MMTSVCVVLHPLTTMAKYSMVGRYYDRWLQAHEPIDKMARRLN